MLGNFLRIKRENPVVVGYIGISDKKLSCMCDSAGCRVALKNGSINQKKVIHRWTKQLQIILEYWSTGVLEKWVQD